MTSEARTAKGGWIDVSVLPRSGMAHWPDNPPVRIEKMLDIEHGDAANVSKISMGSHTGTHMDAPSTSSGRVEGWTRCRSTPPWDGHG